uniref:Uncharacterized protein n=1 Tax=Anguilla anguilla TaxID=7936 RepID=A0A0E9UIG9_ANGAN
MYEQFFDRQVLSGQVYMSQQELHVLFIAVLVMTSLPGIGVYERRNSELCRYLT